MKVVILIPIYKRPEVWAICAHNLYLFIQSVTWDIQVVCLLSPEDKHLSENQKIAMMYWYKCIYYPNLPVSDKMNAGIAYVHKHYEYAYLMNFGSDDLIHPDIEELYKPYFNKQFKLFGINTLYFHDLATGDTIFFDTYNTNGSIGAGRMIHRSVIDWFVFETIPLYEHGLNCGLDTSSAMNIKRNLHLYDVIIDSGEFPYIVDIKTDTNINLYEHVASRERNCKPVYKSVITKHFIL